MINQKKSIDYNNQIKGITFTLLCDITVKNPADNDSNDGKTIQETITA